MQNQGPDVSQRRRKPNGQFDNEFATLAKGPNPFAQMSEDGIDATGRKKLRDWNDLDLPDDEIREWKKAHFTADGAYEWGYGGGCGFYPDQAKEWRRIGIHDPYEADQWNSHGFTPKETVEWARNGFMSFSKDQPALWRDSGFSDPSEAGAWRKAKFNHAQALSWVEADVDIETAIATSTQTGNKFHHIPEMYQWHDQRDLDNPANDAVAVTLDPISRYHLYHKWFQHGFSASAAYYWAMADYSPDQAAELRDKYLEEK